MFLFDSWRRRWYYFKYTSWFKNANGLKGFAEQVMTWLIRNVTKSSQAPQEKVKKLQTKKRELEKRREELAKLPSLANDEFFSTQKKLRVTLVMGGILAATEIFMNYLSTLVLISSPGLLFLGARWAIAIGLTLGATLSVWYLFGAISPAKRKDTPETSEDRHHARKKRWLNVAGGLIAVIFFEVAIIALTSRRAEDIEGAADTGLLYFGFIALACVLPLILGYLWWDKDHYYDAYRNRFTLERNAQEIAKTQKAITSNKYLERKRFTECLNLYWSIFDAFRIYKENYNERTGIPTESMENHFARNKDSFTKEAERQYNQRLEVRADSTATVKPLLNGNHATRQPAEQSSQQNNSRKKSRLIIKRKKATQ